MGATLYTNLYVPYPCDKPCNQLCCSMRRGAQTRGEFWVQALRSVGTRSSAMSCFTVPCCR